MKKLLLVALLFLCSTGCVTVSKDVVALSIDVARVQNETSDSLISSIDASIAELKDSTQIQKLNDLKERLDYLKRGNAAIMKSMTRQITPEELAQILKEK